MSPARLAVFASPTLLQLWPQKALRPDLLEVTTWMEQAEIERYRTLVPDQPLLLHGGNLLGEALPEDQKNALRRLVQITETPWLSVHISLWPWQILQEAQRQGRQPTVLDLGGHLQEFFIRVRALREDLGVPLVLENAPGLPGMANDPESDPETIAAVLEATGCSFLLDLSYAQTAAQNWGYADPHAYLERLPLDRVVELHLSAPRRRQDGRLMDAHESLREEEYALLEWLHRRVSPQIVTLEYWKDPRELAGQVVRLREVLG